MSKIFTIANVEAALIKVLDSKETDINKFKKELRDEIQHFLPLSYRGTLKDRIQVERVKIPKPANLMRPKTPEQAWILANCKGKKITVNGSERGMKLSEKIAEFNKWKADHPAELQVYIDKHKEEMTEYGRRQQLENPKRLLPNYKYNPVTCEYNKIKGSSAASSDEVAEATKDAEEVEEEAGEEVEANAIIESVKAVEEASVKKIKKPKRKTLVLDDESD